MKYKIQFLLFLAIACTVKPEMEGEFSILQGEVQFVDSVRLDDTNFSFAVVYNPKIYNDSILGLGEGSFLGIHLFNSQSGNFIASFESDSIDSYQLPKKNYANFSIRGDSIFLLNNLTRRVYAFGVDKSYRGYYDLDFGTTMHKPEFLTFFERSEGKFLLSSVYDGPLSERFLHSKIVSVFDSKSHILATFGTYPMSYTEGNLVLSQNEIKILKYGHVFILNVAGEPILKQYNIKGDLVGVFPLISEYFDPEIGYYDSDPFSAPLTDQFNGLASDLTSDKMVFYASYHSFDTQERDYGLKSYKWMLMKIDLEQMTIQETQLADVWHLNEVANLIPQVKGDTITIIIRNQDETLYLKRLLFK